MSIRDPTDSRTSSFAVLLSWGSRCIFTTEILYRYPAVKAKQTKTVHQLERLLRDVCWKPDSAVKEKTHASTWSRDCTHANNIHEQGELITDTSVPALLKTNDIRVLAEYNPSQNMQFALSTSTIQSQHSKVGWTLPELVEKGGQRS